MSGPYDYAARDYRAGGWPGVLPLPARQKWPPPPGHTGRSGPDPTSDQIEDWCRRRGGDNVCLRLPAGVVGLDGDMYRPGAAEAWAAAVDRLGPPGDTWSSSSRDDGSGVRLYQITPGVELAGSHTWGEAIQRHHRYLVVWPSVHPEGRIYRWNQPTVPRPEHLPWLPDPWVEDLQQAPAGAAARVGPSAGGTRSWTGGRHDRALKEALRLARLADLHVEGAARELDQLGRKFVASIADRATPAEAQGEWDRIVKGARRIVDTTPAKPRDPMRGFR